MYEALTAEVHRCVSTAGKQSWTPDEPLPEEPSPWLQALLQTLEVLALLCFCVPAPCVSVALFCLCFCL